MSLRFCFGPSGAGKSYQIYKEIIDRSMENPKQNFLIIVPDQFTMQTQKELVTMHERGGIMNIDVLSFGRLSHRILEEVGGQSIPVLDDTGKSLVLQKVAMSIREKLPVLGSHLHKQGYIQEIKSAISESKDCESITYSLQGKIMKFFINVSSETGTTSAQRLGDNIIDSFSETELGYYDVSIYITSVSENELYPMIGYKSKNENAISWTVNKGEVNEE